MEQSASRLVRNAASWYAHSYVYDDIQIMVKYWKQDWTWF